MGAAGVPRALRNRWRGCHRGAWCTVSQIMATIFVSSVNFIVESIPEVGGGPESVPWFIELVEWVRHAE